MTITLVHSNPITIERGVLRVDRKFHVGMLRYASRIDGRVTTLNPIRRSDQSIMDTIEVDLRELPYDVSPVETDGNGVALASELTRLRPQLARSTLVYGGELGIAAQCRALRVPYILILEYDLQTQIAATTLEISGRVRRRVRSARCAWRYLTQGIPEIRAAHSVHCNGFPVYESARRHNAHCLLYLDSRMTEDMLISADQLQGRLSHNRQRPLRLLYSGRYEPFKGALDVVRVAAECIRRGLDVELHCYGQGSLRGQMLRTAAGYPDRLQVHEAIPYPQLVEVSRSFDIFVCCHVQNDPSCTYLEALGAGLPVVGYANAMWRSMRAASQAGLCSKMGLPGEVAGGIETLFRDRSMLTDMSMHALAYARHHLFETEFDKRIDAINAAAAQCRVRPGLRTAEA
jgi:glycosyltransferase involved in cell wall biosynthesis